MINDIHIYIYIYICCVALVLDARLHFCMPQSRPLFIVCCFSCSGFVNSSLPRFSLLHFTRGICMCFLGVIRFAFVYVLCPARVATILFLRP